MLFCGGCGNELERRCPKCGFDNPLDFRFCGQCGQKLTAARPAPTADLALIDRRLPAELRQRALAQRASLEGERRQVTVLFSDLAGYTPLVEKIGSEEAYVLMERLYEILIDKVYELEGTVNELTGDGILALFGAPVALEDAPQRAVRSALAIHRALARFSEEGRRERRALPPLKMRIGIHSGPVVVGKLGNDLRVEFKAVGDTVNLASRVGELAEPATTLVTEETFRSCEGIFRFEALGEHRVKGREQPVRVYRAIAASSSRTRFDVSAERGLTPFVGRERELELLLDSYQRARSGRGQIVSIVSEAGLGKSRLLYEFRKAVSHEDVTFFEGRCLSYGRRLVYYPILDLLRSSFDVGEDDDESTIRAKVASGLEWLEVDSAPTLPGLLELLTLARGDSDELLLTPELIKVRLIRALTGVALAAAERRPLILAVEDLHWIDEGSEELMRQLVRSVSGASVLLLVTYRSEYVPSWGAKSFHSQLNLGRLSNRETLLMARHQLGEVEMTDAVAEVVLEKSEGVPLFVEELVRSMQELGLIELAGGRYGLARGIEAVGIPSTIRDVLMARVDALPEGARRVLKTASVIEREFSHRLIQGLMNLPEQELLAHLSVLKDGELLYERGVYPHSTYLFRHNLTREVVYDSLLSQSRKELHRRTGELIERLYGQNLHDKHGILAEHFIAGEDWEKGAEYSRLAARKSLYSGSVPAAIEHAQRHVRCLEELPHSVDTSRRLTAARSTLAGYFLIVSRILEARAAVEPLTVGSPEIADSSSLPAILTAIGLYELYANEDQAQAMVHLDSVLQQPGDKHQAVWHWFANYYLAGFHCWRCEFSRSRERLDKCRELSTGAKQFWGVSIANSTQAWCHAHQGRIDLARRQSEEALEQATESEDPLALALAHLVVGMGHYFEGSFETSRSHLAAALRGGGGAEQTLWRVYMLTYLADALGELGDHDAAAERCEEAIASLEAVGLLPSWASVLHLNRARARALSGARVADLGQLERWRSAERLPLWEGQAARLAAEVTMLTDEEKLDQADIWLRQAIAADELRGLAWQLARDHLGLAELHRRRGDRAAMGESLDRARELFAECGAAGWARIMEERKTLEPV
jgi:class 3 adenylate cyclase/tetratricopeptide (TPR) repeat protein